MNVSSYLEAFLTVYGWEMYYVLYLLFGSLGLFLYPIVRVVNEGLVDYFSGNEYAGTNFLRQLLSSLSIIVIVFVIALVPAVPISLDTTKVKTVCSEETDAKDKNDQVKDAFNNTYFQNIDTKVPFMPWIAMSIGQGFNGVIYKQTPCALDVTESKNAMMNIDFSHAENPEILRSELTRFVNECHSQAVNLTKQVMENKDNSFGEQASTLVKDKLDALKSSTDKSEAVILGNYDSSLIKEMFYSPNSPLKSIEETKTLAPLKAKAPVNGFNGYESDGSQKQGTTASPPSCSEWWSAAGAKGLRNRVLAALEDSAITNVAKNTDVHECRIKPYQLYRMFETIDPASCKARIVKELYAGDESKLADQMFENLQGHGATDKIATTQDNVMAIGGAIVGAVASIAGIELGQSQVVSTITGFYAQMYIVKKLLHNFIPMILMAVYMFWALFLTVGELRPNVMLRGMILIIALNMMPGLWSIIEHLDDGLYAAMYEGDSIVNNPMNRFFLDAATTVFEIAIVFVVFYLISEAGSASTKGAVSETQSSSGSLAGGAGAAIGGGAGRAMGTAGKGAGKVSSWGKQTYSDYKTKTTPYKVTQPGSGTKK